MMTEARRRASQAYKERQEREGIKVVSFRLCKEVRDALAVMSTISGVSQSRAVEMALKDAVNRGAGIMRDGKNVSFDDVFINPACEEIPEE